MKLREALIEQELNASKAYFGSTGIAPDRLRIEFFHRLSTAADLKYYIDNAFSTASSKKREAFYVNNGFKPYREIVEEHIDEVVSSKRTTINDFKSGSIVSSYVICLVSGDFNIQHGMSYNSEDKLHPFVVLKSKIGGRYSDTFTSDPRFYNYSPEKESDPANFLTGNFRKHTNKIIYEDFVQQEPLTQSEQIPLHLFVHTTDLEKTFYRYVGIYFMNSLNTEEMIFELINEKYVINPLSFSDTRNLREIQSLKNERQSYLDKYYQQNIGKIVGGNGLIEVNASKYSFNGFNKGPRTGMNFDALLSMVKDYARAEKFFSEIGKVGEDLVYEFEKNRVKKFAPQVVREIKKVDDSKGFDFQSFDKFGRNIVPIQIEVKTTPKARPDYRFFMSRNEFEVMSKNSDTYWLYRVFDLRKESSPKLYAIRGKVKEKLDFVPADFACSIK